MSRVRVFRRNKEEVRARALKLIDQLITFHELPGPWQLAGEIDNNLFLLGFDAHSVLGDGCVEDELVTADVEKLRLLRSKVEES